MNIKGLKETSQQWNVCIGSSRDNGFFAKATSIVPDKVLPTRQECSDFLKNFPSKKWKLDGAYPNFIEIILEFEAKEDILGCEGKILCTVTWDEESKIYTVSSNETNIIFQEIEGQVTIGNTEAFGKFCNRLDAKYVVLQRK